MIVKIEKLVSGGFGMALNNDRIVFIPYTVPGEEVEIEIVEKHKDYDDAKLVKVIKSSDKRIEPRCPYFGKCGGCQWQHIDYEYQLEWKRKIIEEAWKRIAKIDVKAEGVIPSPNEWNYRNRIQLHVDKWGNVGFKERGTHKVVNIEKCLIADEKLNDQLLQKRDQIKYWRKGLSLNLDDERNVDGNFAQVNTLQNTNLKNAILDIVKSIDAKNVVELYAGGGNLTFALAMHVESITAIEIDKYAVKGGMLRAKENGFDNVEFLWGSSDTLLKDIKSIPDVILLDPPRTGAKDSISGIINANSKHIIYVSCDPATLARDSIRLMEAEYKINRCQPLDMFPQTYHVETVMLFEK